jgi:hypothetical protein
LSKLEKKGLIQRQQDVLLIPSAAALEKIMI